MRHLISTTILFVFGTNAYDLEKSETMMTPTLFFCDWDEGLCPSSASKSFEVHIYVFHYVSCAEMEIPEHYEALLTKGEQARLSRYIFHDKKKEFLLARLFLKGLLSLYVSKNLYGCSLPVNDYGKPGLDDSRLQFNLSHSKNAIACSISQHGPVGVDIEKLRSKFTDVLDIANRFFTKKEIAYLKQTPKDDQLRTFYRLFTMKEAYMKAVGMGFHIPLNSIDVPLSEDRGSVCEWDFVTMPFGNAYILSNVIHNPQRIPCRYRFINVTWDILEKSIIQEALRFC